VHFARSSSKKLLESFYIYPLARNVPIIASAWPPWLPIPPSPRSVRNRVHPPGWLPGAHASPSVSRSSGSSYHTQTRTSTLSVNSAARLPRSPKKSKLGVGPGCYSDLLRQFLPQTITARRGSRAISGLKLPWTARYHKIRSAVRVEVLRHRPAWSPTPVAFLTPVDWFVSGVKLHSTSQVAPCAGFDAWGWPTAAGPQVDNNRAMENLRGVDSCKRCCPMPVSGTVPVLVRTNNWVGSSRQARISARVVPGQLRVGLQSTTPE